MSEHGKSFCKACAAPIVWLRHVSTGKMAPIDAFPDEGGNVIASFGDGQYRLATEADPRFELYTNHFQTCPAAASFRR